MFEILEPGEGDCRRMAEIHVKAMHSNPLLHAQFPTNASIHHHETFLERHYGLVRSSATSRALIAKHVTSGRVASFAYWETDIIDGDQEHGKIEDSKLKYSKSCRKEYLEQYTALAETAEKNVMRGEACYRLSSVCVRPDHQGQGAGTLLAESVLARAQARSVPVYLESTLEAVRIYERLGFAAVGGFEMDIPRSGANTPTEKYREVSPDGAI
ncbi:hypothetical protein PspLS_00597 [Pyricularia sp. CBS 133598]|nr:hypothetical protein PspLS_00597 [Pyricularia sp. CBS 133598]